MPTTIMMNKEKKNFTEALNAPFSLSSEQIAGFRENGFIKLKEVFTEEVLEYYSEVITNLVFLLNKNTAPMEKRSTYDKAFLQVFNLWYKDDVAKEFVFSKRLGRLATDLMGTKGVRLYHDQALYKESGGGITPWHADQYYWPFESPKTITVWIPFQATPMEMGPLAFAAKSHNHDIGRDLEISDDSEQTISEELKKRNLEYHNTPFDLGEVSFHYGWTFHNAGANTSGSARKVMTMIYMDKDITLSMPRNKEQLVDWEKWCSLVKIGETVAGPLNPILFEY
jgi:ectoine hydroxylase-related dioxygenase (phytanoyl-CoA dioxygenase family)